MLPVPFDYETLRLIWWVLLGVLLIGFAVTDGFDLGVGLLLPLVARTDTERRIAINSIGPVWEGNQVWFILGGGAIFAAYPPIYAAAFSGFYLAMFLVLVALILRPVGFDFRNKVADRRWRAVWDAGLFIGGFVPALVFGVAFGNLLQGVPFHYDADLRLTYEGGLLGLLNPFALLCGLVSVAMLGLHGAIWLLLKTDGPVAARSRSAVTVLAPALLVLFALAGLWAAGLEGYVAQGLDPNGASNPLAKSVVREGGALMRNYGLHPWMRLAPVLAVAGTLAAWGLVRLRREGLALLASGIGITGVVATAGVSLFPFLMPSSLDPVAGLTVFDATSSHQTLFVMLLAALVFVPLILAYTGFVYSVLRGKVTAEQVERNSHSLY
ncbi:cytochrome d ubiquinol oxidase subunit II [Oleisolibacter albus]|uniref:cytochrome d ubiquinol oxidase subunit II n=1 Tax=Oleisolibacter albus TaxID=2171757 RepID=UPI000DF49357|nr:cytochrome d ubiquinol oxidase subunit II [Oleisolibacter albus]